MVSGDTPTPPRQHETRTGSRWSANSVNDEVVLGPCPAARKGPRTMFVDEMRRAIEAAPRSGLPDVAKALWSAVAGGQIDETDAELLSGMIDARQVVTRLAPARRSVGSRPRSSASIERRRRWAASGALPVALASRFTISEQAALSVVADEVRKNGHCSLFIGHVAALAGVGETTVRNALRAAKRFGLITVEIRRVTAWRNDANVVRIISADWTMWLARASRGPGYKFAKGTVSSSSRAVSDRVGRLAQTKGYREESGADANAPCGYPLRSPETAHQGDRRRSGYQGAGLASRPSGAF